MAWVLRYDRLITGFAVALIVLTGATIWYVPRQWWWPSAALIPFFFLIVAAHDMVSVIKATVACLVVVLESAGAVTMGALIAGTPVGLSWMCAIIFVALVMIAWSYAFPAHRSRWVWMTLCVSLGFAISYVWMMAAPHVEGWIPVLVGGVVSLVAFFVAFRSSPHWSDMPDNDIPDDDILSLWQEATDKGWHAMVSAGARGRGILVWQHHQGFFLWPARFQSPLGLVGKRRRTVSLGYEGHNITNWLFYLSTRVIPSWPKLRGADIVTVVVDMTGLAHFRQSAPVVAVSLPDTRRTFPVLVSSRAHVFDVLDHADEVIVQRPLNAKQEKALSRTNVFSRTDDNTTKDSVDDVCDDSSNGETVNDGRDTDGPTQPHDS